jgi:hypothetical protein
MPTNTEIEALTPWGEILILDIPPPKAGVALVAPYRVLFQRCRHDPCNRIFPVSAKRNKIYCDDICYDAAKGQRKKIRNALL